MSRPMSNDVHVERSPRRIRTMFGGETLADSTRAVLVWRSGWPPVPAYYFLRDDVRRDLLVESEHSAEHPGLGTARYWSIRVGDRMALNAVFGYPESPIAELRDHLRFQWREMDAWYEEDEEVWVHARDPYHRVDVVRSSRHVEVMVAGERVADSHRPYLLFETGMPVRYYLPKLDVRMDLLQATDTVTNCPYKGRAQYWSLVLGETVHEDAVWCYHMPLPETAKIADLVCFYNEKVEIIVDGVAEERPVTGFSKPDAPAAATPSF